MGFPKGRNLTVLGFLLLFHHCFLIFFLLCAYLHRVSKMSWEGFFLCFSATAAALQNKITDKSYQEKNKRRSSKAAVCYEGKTV